jgi:hypothetical protein
MRVSVRRLLWQLLQSLHACAPSRLNHRNLRQQRCHSSIFANRAGYIKRNLGILDAQLGDELRQVLAGVHAHA